jgi:hypothetical protein
MLTFILQNNWVAAMTARFAEAVRAHGREIDDFSVMNDDEIPDRIREKEGNLFFYGSTELVRRVSDDEKLRRFLFFDIGQFDQRIWVENRERDLLNGQGVSVSWGELKELAAREPVFARPTFEQKSFAGALVTPESAQDWFTRMEKRNGRLVPESQVWVSTPKSILEEYRFIVLDGRIVTGSRYRAGGVLAASAQVPAAVLAEAARLARGWLPARLVTMDVAVLENGAVKIIEFNSIHSSGLYAADKLALIEAIERAYAGPA